MAKELPSDFFKVLGSIFSICVVVLWGVVGFGTVKRYVYLFFSCSSGRKEVGREIRRIGRWEDVSHLCCRGIDNEDRVLIIRFDRALTGEIFVAPCLKDLKENESSSGGVCESAA